MPTVTRPARRLTEQCAIPCNQSPWWYENLHRETQDDSCQAQRIGQNQHRSIAGPRLSRRLEPYPAVPIDGREDRITGLG